MELPWPPFFPDKRILCTRADLVACLIISAYNYPNDPTEVERLDDQHEIIKLVMDGRNYLAPFSKDKPPKNVLDIATGTGTWAIEMGDEFPEAKVTGTDLSPIQPQYVPLNVRFYIEDA